MELKTISAIDYCKFVTDGTHDSPKPKESGYKLITSKHLKRYDIDFDSANYISEEDYKKVIERSSVEQWDILFSMIGTIGNTYIETNNDINYACKNIGIFQMGRDEIKAKWLYYYLQTPKAKAYIEAVSRGTTQGYVPLGALRKMPIEITDDDNTKKIVSLLWELDEIIKGNIKINSNLEQQAQAIFNKMFPDITIGDSCVGDMITPQRGKGLLSKDAVAGNVPVVAGGLEPATYHNTANTIAPVLTISASGANAGFVNLWHIPVWSSDSSYIDSSLTPHVYFWYTLLKKRQKEIFDAQTGSAQPHIYPQNIANLPLGSIKAEDIAQFNDIVTPMFQKIGENKIENTKLSATRDILLPKLMSGEIDLSNIDI